MSSQEEKDRRFGVRVVIIIIFATTVVLAIGGVVGYKIGSNTSVQAVDITQIRVDQGNGQYFDINNVEIKETLRGDQGSTEVVITGEVVFPFGITSSSNP